MDDEGLDGTEVTGSVGVWASEIMRETVQELVLGKYLCFGSMVSNRRALFGTFRRLLSFSPLALRRRC